MARKNQIALKLLIDKDKNRVVFVESNGDFIDVLFSLLTLPMGTTVRLFQTQSCIGSLDNLYKSLLKLNKEHLQTPECFNMLSRPRSAYETICKKLKIIIDDSESTKYYMCPESMCSYDMLSTIRNSKCRCGEIMSEEKNISVDCDGFLKRMTNKFIVTDDLQVMPVSTTVAAFTLLKGYGVGEKSKLEKQPIDIGPDEVLLLLKHAFLSKEPFTDVFLRNQELALTKNVKVEQREIPEYLKRKCQLNNSKMISLKLIVSKSQNKVLYAEAGAEFLDFLFSFLTLPLGSIIKLLGGNCSMGCIANLYSSVTSVMVSDCTKSEKYSGILLDPKLPQHFNCSSQVLRIDEEAPMQYCYLCIVGRLHSGSFPCPYHENQVELNVINPKSPNAATETGGGFMKDAVAYMVTDKLSVSPLSPMQAMSHFNTLNVPVDNIEEQVVLVGEEEGLQILKASLTSKTVLNDVFAPKSTVERLLVEDFLWI
ncbi:hypothetical protein IFM89_004195 [Coptis chinensis]|uniref:DUF674 family protein n=1 Tax=Coptis chinensis TaxID=261450 RepID=A0A835LHJ2_9MAGN|nr:hypothetical protein IFM89_004195 [Coptis chinensis]